MPIGIIRLADGNATPNRLHYVHHDFAALAYRPDVPSADCGALHSISSQVLRNLKILPDLAFQIYDLGHDDLSVIFKIINMEY